MDVIAEQPAATVRARRRGLPLAPAHTATLGLSPQELCAIVILTGGLIQVSGVLTGILQIAATIVGFGLAIRRLDRPVVVILPLVLAFPAFAAISALWSDVPSVSLKYGAEVFLTALIGIVLASSVKLERFPYIVFVASSLFLIGSLLNGAQGATTEGFVLIGLTGSKNSFGYANGFALLAQVAILIGLGRLPLLFRVLAVLPMMFLSAWFLLTGHAAGAQIGAVIGIAVMVSLLAAGRLSRGAQGLLFVCAVFGMALSVSFAGQLSAAYDDFKTTTLRKDRTMSGRLQMWEVADQLIADKPILGHGFRSTWLGESQTTIGLLRLGKVPTGLVFSFHDTYREIMVDLGVIGLALFVVPFTLALVTLFVAATIGRQAGASFALAVLTCLIVLPFRVENIVGAFGYIYPVFVAAICWAGSIIVAGRLSTVRVWRRKRGQRAV